MEPTRRSFPTASQAFLAKRIFTAVGAEGTLIEDAALVLDDNQILYVGPARDVDLVAVPANDLGDVTVLPGLVDAHAHLTLPADKRNYEQVHQDPDEMLALVCVMNLRKHLAAGVTTIRDNGGRNRVTFTVRDAIRRGYLAGPRLLLCGRPVTQRLGHFYFCGGTADGPVEIRATVRALVAEGADHIKIMASGGATLGNLPYYAAYTVEEMKAAVDAAHDLGRLTTGHCRATQSMRYALEAGFDAIEHAEFLEADLSRKANLGAHHNLQGGQSVYDGRLAQQLLEAGTFISTTLQCGGYDTVVDLRDKKDAVGLTEQEQGQLDALQFYFEQKVGNFSHLIKDGFVGKLAISSDAGPFDTAFGRMDLGLCLGVEGGMTTRQALVAATRIGAELCGVADEVGTLEPGKLADFFAVDGDPTRNIADIAKVTGVWADGHLRSHGPGVGVDWP
ncbi:amidohydrolase family protein [Frankia sp. AgB1.9]|uniref:amidohydrolase family protein n=1 Tax=unclassified Frankia TaxID=2632575 RepID=UPI0019338CE7|nr:MULTISPECIES: amidohydrolase family protein [unclassified Frankia]MBL7492624.1 amidohydrolase family protein [Frankia sp. AgW1.1]MBL7549327.1 amidohydrolase family protein [Frankia sp. AgB1.9]MBL7619206.1 amidohydrolase family protein [Frankia sp. AgB1.8]